MKNNKNLAQDKSPLPPKDRRFKEPSLLEVLSFGLYKTKEYDKR